MRRGTYSIVARDPPPGELGVAVQSHWFGVGPIVPWARAGRRRGRDAVGGRARLRPASAGPLADGDAGARRRARRPARRRRAGRATARSRSSTRAAGSPCTPATGCIACAGDERGDGFSAQANMMASTEVWPAMAPPSRPPRPAGAAAAGRAARRRGHGRRRARAPVGGAARRARAGRGVADVRRPARRRPPRAARRARPAARPRRRLRARDAGRRPDRRGPARRGGRRATPAPARSRRTTTSCCSGPASAAAQAGDMPLALERVRRAIELQPRLGDLLDAWSRTSRPARPSCATPWPAGERAGGLLRRPGRGRAPAGGARPRRPRAARRARIGLPERTQPSGLRPPHEGHTTERQIPSNDPRTITTLPSATIGTASTWPLRRLTSARDSAPGVATFRGSFGDVDRHARPVRRRRA